MPVSLDVIDQIAFHESASLFDIRQQAGSYFSTVVKVLSFKLLNRCGSHCHGLSEIILWKQLDYAAPFNAIQF
jgi:hypothetical protein